MRISQTSSTALVTQLTYLSSMNYRGDRGSRNINWEFLMVLGFWGKRQAMHRGISPARLRAQPNRVFYFHTTLGYHFCCLLIDVDWFLLCFLLKVMGPKMNLYYFSIRREGNFSLPAERNFPGSEERQLILSRTIMWIQFNGNQIKVSIKVSNRIDGVLT